MKQNIFNGVASLVGGAITFSFGEWSQLLSLFLFVVLLDYISGISASIVEGKGLNSAVGFKGLIKKFAIVLIIALSYQIDKALGLDVIMSGAIYFFLANELISVVENYGRMGLPLPSQIKKIIQVLKDKSGQS
jgi:toxin secretion/phage lysis holin